MKEIQNRGMSSGFLLALLASSSFAFSGTFARSLLDVGWSPGAILVVRLGGAALVVVIPTVIYLLRHWEMLRPSLPVVLLYGVVPIALCQLFYFNAVQYLSVGVALLLEFLGPVFLVFFSWFRERNRPPTLVLLGAGAALLGLILVLNITSGQSISLIGVLWGLGAGICLAIYFVLCDRVGDALPPFFMVGGGISTAAFVMLGLGLSGLIPMKFGGNEVTLLGEAVGAWAPLLGLVLVSTVFSYCAEILAVQRLGVRVASFAAYAEVLFAVLWAWLFLGQLPQPIQLLGGVMIVLGILLVRIGQGSRVGLSAEETEGAGEEALTKTDM